MFIMTIIKLRNKQSKITVHETDILNSHFTEHFYRQSRLTAVEQITFHDTKIKHFTRTNIDHSRLTKIPFPTLIVVVCIMVNLQLQLLKVAFHVV
jgi:hypothetical protein